MENKKPYGTVLIKASYILDYLAEHPDASLQEIAKGIDMTSSTTLKILDTLSLIGYVNKNQEKNYRLGAKLVRYANKNIDQIDLVERTLPFLEKLQQTIDETIHLGILDNNEIPMSISWTLKIKRSACLQKSVSPDLYIVQQWGKLS